MRTLYGLVTYPVLVAFVMCCLFSTVTPGTARAGTWRTVLGIFGAVTGAAILATLAASFGPVGIVCAGMLGAGLGFVGGAAIGALVGGTTGGFWGAMGGLGTGGILGAAVGALAGGMLAAQFGIVGICAGALVGAWGGGKLAGAFDDRPARMTAEKPSLASLRESYLQTQSRLRQALSVGSPAEVTAAQSAYQEAQLGYFKARSTAAGY